MKNKVAIVTGASSGIGRATAKLFAENGATVVGVGRNEKELLALRDELNGADGTIRPHLGDVMEVTQLDRIVSETIDSFGQIDTLVNAAGVLKGGSIEDCSLSDWDKQMNINVRSVYYLMQKCIPHLEKTKGSIVNVSSVTGTRAFPGVLAYCVSKAAVDQLTRCAALDLAPKGIRVNAVNPGVVVTNLHKRGGMDDAAYAKFLERTKETHPLGRAGNAEEIADLIHFLASEKAGWITGATYAIDGGRAETCAR
ncbi:MAG TPA: SDR family oxidoreductase [Pyrinomonadaceae bacterium]|nr:SDR family oxidoreductase [Pyrinomonadaceae bacterium]